VLLALLFAILLPTDAGASVAGSFSISDPFFDTPTPIMDAGAIYSWQFKFWDSVTGLKYHHFHPMHEKEMHLIVVSQDLSHFAHIHPTIDHHAGSFEVLANAQSKDPDNKDLVRTIPFSGKYFLFADVMPMGETMTVLPYDLTTSGTPRASQAFVLDPLSLTGSITKTLDNYKVELTPIAEHFP
jgi:hypothetical protein